MRVDNVPLWLTPPFHLFGYGGASILQGFMALGRLTCRIERQSSAFAGPRIECLWHEHLPAYTFIYLSSRSGRRYVNLNHPAWFMRPIHVMWQWNGVEIALGSTGHGGQAALERVTHAVRAGASTSIAVDGPAGPAHKLKRGALDMARDSGAPIVAIRFEYDLRVRGKAWDRKEWPVPGSRIRVVESEPLYVNAHNYEAQRARVTEALG